MADGVTSARSAAIKDFAALLRELRGSVGSPSFREMSGRSSAISHTTLHEAAQGNRLPSWPTTVEFVKACGADPDDYRERWQQADARVRETGAPTSAQAPVTAEPDGPVETVEPVEPAEPDVGIASADEPPNEQPARRRRVYALTGIAAVAVAAAATIGVVAAFGGDDSAPRPTANTLLQPSDCPVRQSNPPSAAPAHAGDAEVFVHDITLPDCSHMRRGQTVAKVWRFKNVGTVAWRGYMLHRVNPPQQRGQCQTIADVPIPDTAPGAMVDVKTDVTAPQTTGLCFVRFKMEDAAGKLAFPGSRPVFFQVIVD